MTKLPKTNWALLLYAFCVLLSLLVYFTAFDNPFRQDDMAFLSHAETHSLREALTPQPGFAFYRPGALALFSMEYALFGRNGGAYIAFNYALHVINSILVMLIVLRLVRDRNVALVASGLFLVGFGHYGKQVMWACTSGSLAGVMLSLIAVLIVIRGVQSTENGETRGRLESLLRSMTVLVLLTVSAFCHEGALAVFILVAFIAYTQDREKSVRKLAGLLIVLLPVIVGLWLVISESYPGYRALSGDTLSVSKKWIPMFSLTRGLLDAPVYLVRYLGFMVLPLQPTALVNMSGTMGTVMQAALQLHIVFGLAMLAGLLYLVLRGRGALRVLGVWLLLVLLPFTLVAQPPGHLELRYLYNASIPLCILTAMGVVALLGQRKLVYRIVGGGVVVVALAGSAALALMLERSYHRWPRASTPDARPAAPVEGSVLPGGGSTWQLPNWPRT
jgi:hypothetical protein